MSPISRFHICWAYICSARLKFSTDDSDLLTNLAAYNAVGDLNANGQGGKTIRAFCEDVRTQFGCSVAVSSWDIPELYFSQHNQRGLHLAARVFLCFG